MDSKKLASAVVEKMYSNDHFSKWLGIERVKIDQGKAILQMQIKKEMLNGFNILHGGIYYSLADSALAFASNSYGVQSVSIETSISHVKPCKEGDWIIAETEELSMSNKIGIYQVVIKNQNDEKVALFKGTVYRTSRNWEID